MNADGGQREGWLLHQLFTQSEGWDISAALTAVGSKAANLAWLVSQRQPAEQVRFNVPKAFCVSLSAMWSHKVSNAPPLSKLSSSTSSSFTPLSSELRYQLGEFISSLAEDDAYFCETSPNSKGWSVAVRSSGTREDLPTSSLAGLYRTELNVRGSLERIEASIRNCWTSAAQIEGGDHGVGVLIQQQINSQASGVAFYVRGQDEKQSEDVVVIEAWYGQGHGLVSGEVVPTRITVTTPSGYVSRIPTHHRQSKKSLFKYVLDESSEEGGLIREDLLSAATDSGGGLLEILSDEQAKLVGKLCADATRAFNGVQQDIEFAFDGKGKLWLLQSRPIVRPLNSSAHENRAWIPPDRPGRWRLDVAHNPRPCTRLFQSIFANCITAGSRTLCQRYGLLRQVAIDMHFINGMAYQRSVPLSTDPSSEQEFKQMCQEHPLLVERLAVASRVFEDKPWRETLHKWNTDIKPAMLARNRRLQQVPLGSLSMTELGAHIKECLVHFSTATQLHHELQGAYLIPMGDFLSFAHETTGIPIPLLVPVCRPDTPCPFVAEMEDPVKEAFALSESDSARKVLMQEDPSKPTLPSDEILRSLLDDPIVGGAVRSFLFEFGAATRIVDGYDLCQPTAKDLPSILVQMLRKVLTDAESHPLPSDSVVAQIRSALADKPELRAPYADRLAAAQQMYHFRDEKALILDSWAAGIFRSALLEFGRRLVAEKLLQHEDDILEASKEELLTMTLADADGSMDRDALARLSCRRANRIANSGSFAPLSIHGLGGPRSVEDLPESWFPEHGCRVEKAFRAMKSANQPVSGNLTASAESPLCRGSPVSAGRYTGVARVIASPEDLKRVLPGDVVVMSCSSSGFIIFGPMLGALVTDYGGALSHAAILARELGVPCVAGCLDATSQIVDGDTVIVDGFLGCVFKHCS